MSTRTFTLPAPAPLTEHRREFACFGGTCTVIVADRSRPADAAMAAATAERALLSWHRRFSRFDPDSELMRFNRDPRTTVPASPMLRRLVEMALAGSRATGGLVDATMGREIEQAGYDSHFEGTGIPLDFALSLAPPRAEAGPSPVAATDAITVDSHAGEITRPLGVSLDPGGIAKGVFADELAVLLSGFDAFAVDCAGDIRLGGRWRLPRPIHVAGPFDDAPLHTFELRDGAIATSGIGKRSWLNREGLPAHHLLDPRTGEPAFTGVVQATALAPTAAQAEVLAKAGVLTGPRRAAEWLSHGGVVVYDSGAYAVFEPAGAPAAAAAEAPTRAASQARMSASTSSRSGSFTIS
jgi:thiamine biosynthesis lipoprotein